jgi:beta-N-acetylhexosaminidase
VNLDFAPVLDIDTNPSNPIIGDRSFGETPDVVIEQAMAFAEGLREGGVLSCGKHFPGHGDTDLDSHDALPVLRHDRSRLDRVELAPFRAAVGRLPSLMTAHVVLDSMDSMPATLSRPIIEGLLRKQIGYEGAVFTDDLEMKAVSASYPIEESGVLAIEAGCDLLLVCSDVAAVGRLRETLIRKADRHPAFAQRLEEARARADVLRRSIATLAPPIPLEIALEGLESRGLRQRIGELG